MRFITLKIIYMIYIIITFAAAAATIIIIIVITNITRTWQLPTPF